MKWILHVVGARPNFMKIAPIMREMTQYPAEFEQILVHTGQHYDANMLEVSIDEVETSRWVLASMPDGLPRSCSGLGIDCAVQREGETIFQAVVTMGLSS